MERRSASLTGRPLSRRRILVVRLCLLLVVASCSAGIGGSIIFQSWITVGSFSAVLIAQTLNFCLIPSSNRRQILGPLAGGAGKARQP